jgi:hypothetical protein
MFPDYYRNGDLCLVSVIEKIPCKAEKVGPGEFRTSNKESASTMYNLLKDGPRSARRKRDFVYGAFYYIMRMNSVYSLHFRGAAGHVDLLIRRRSCWRVLESC